MDHLSPQQIAQYQQRALSPTERLTVSDHLGACAECRERLRRSQAAAVTVAALNADLQAALTEEDHLSYEEMAAYIDGAASETEREIVEGHIEVCGSCADELKELRAFRAVLSTYPEQPLAPAPPVSWTQRLRDRLRLPSRRAPRQWAGAAMAVTILLLAVGLWRGRNPGRASDAGRDERLRLLAQLADTQAQKARVETALKEAQERQREAALDADHRQAQIAKARREADTARRQIADSRQQIAQMETALRRAKSAHEMITRGDGRVLVADAKGNPTWMPTPQSALAAAKKARTAAIPQQVAMLMGTEGDLRGTEETFRIVAPLGTAIRDTRPTFAWTTQNGARRYRISLYDPDHPEQDKDIATGETTADHWRPEKPLPRSKAMQWQVTALLRAGGSVVAPRSGVQPRAKFRILDADTVRAVDALTQGAERSEVDRGLLCWQFGLLDEAEAHFEHVGKTDPHYAQAQQLLKTLRAQRHRKM